MNKLFIILIIAFAYVAISRGQVVAPSPAAILLQNNPPPVNAAVVQQIGNLAATAAIAAYKAQAGTNSDHLAEIEMVLNQVLIKVRDTNAVAQLSDKVNQLAAGISAIQSATNTATRIAATRDAALAIAPPQWDDLIKQLSEGAGGLLVAYGVIRRAIRGYQVNGIKGLHDGLFVGTNPPAKPVAPSAAPMTLTQPQPPTP